MGGKDIDARTDVEGVSPGDVARILDNPFVEGFRDGKITYTRDFHVAMYKKIHDEGMTYVAAYRALGFDTRVLGENRANSVGRRVRKMAKENRLFTIDPSSYDGSVPRDLMGELSPEEEIAYLRVRNLYLERVVEAQKKLPSALAATLTSWRPASQASTRSCSRTR